MDKTEWIKLVIKMAGFRANSEIIGKFRKLKKFYDHFVKREKFMDFHSF